ncbi:MAG TPA: Gfo/Idh/MocA family oxidoreductase, partial [Tepidisphaeraceae bacterium]|nr:Gfo/Idh/MocA family oxidoreductase [Tepidisphaeraceae bacterium]
MKTSALVGAGLIAGAGCAASGKGDSVALGGADVKGSMVGFKVAPIETVRIGFVGVGGRGTGLLHDFMRCPGVEIKAVCDIRPERAARAAKILKDAGKAEPAQYTKGDHDFENLVKRDDLDLVITPTPWEWHVPVCLAAMNAGKHACSEVPMALTVDDCWKLIHTAEKTQRHCMMMENCCYGESELAVLNAVRQGAFGEVLHAEGGYLHDLQAVKFDENGEGNWRRRYSEMWDGNLYPTHGLGPVAQCMNINRGDKFDRLVSMSTPARGLALYAAEKFGKDDPRAKANYKCGDINTSLIQTARGKTIMVQHATNLPRPYSRINTIVGTKGVFAGYPDRVGIGEQWGDLNAFLAKYEHPLWKRTKESAKGSGHGGMDFVMAYRLIECLHKGEALDQSVYDGAA